ncbi:MAG: hypothetical protein ACE5DO_15140 [Desulfobacterales bacterium]
MAATHSQDKGQIFLGREIAQHRDYSEETAQEIDEEIDMLIKRNYNRARKILDENIDILHKLVELLLEKETVAGSEMDDLIRIMKPGTELSAKIN